MSRRTGREQAALGSDSFLDIVANIVGILIILIVVAGVRVSSAPVTLPEPDPVDVAEVEADEWPAIDEEQPETAALAAVEVDDEPADAVVSLVIPEPEEPDETEEPPPVRGPSPELVRQVEALERELAALEAASAAHSADMQKTAARERDVQQTLDAKAIDLAADTDVLEVKRRQLAGLQSAVEETRGKLQAARLRLEAEEQEKPPVRQIRHRLTPVSRVVQDKELHFHLSGGRVAHVPVEELTERLRAQVMRQKDWLIKYRRHQGVVGPVEGFTMHYTVERESLSVVDELRHGTGIMKIGVSQWQLKPEAHLEAESVQQALRPGSAFFRQLKMADIDATLTFWVYPDSFAAYRQLQQFAHAEGFTVAARPLPFGVPISGSPQGTRSAGQ